MIIDVRGLVNMIKNFASDLEFLRMKEEQEID